MLEHKKSLSTLAEPTCTIQLQKTTKVLSPASSWRRLHKFSHATHIIHYKEEGKAFLTQLAFRKLDTQCFYLLSLGFFNIFCSIC